MATITTATAANDLYAEIKAVKNLIADWDNDYDLATLITEGFIDPNVSDSIRGLAARKVVKAGYLERGFKNEWQFDLPSTKDAMNSDDDFSLVINGLLFKGHYNFDECPMSQIKVDMRELLNKKYDASVPEYELVEDLVEMLYTEVYSA